MSFTLTTLFIMILAILPGYVFRAIRHARTGPPVKETNSKALVRNLAASLTLLGLGALLFAWLPVSPLDILEHAESVDTLREGLRSWHLVCALLAQVLILPALSGVLVSALMEWDSFQKLLAFMRLQPKRTHQNFLGQILSDHFPEGAVLSVTTRSKESVHGAIAGQEGIEDIPKDASLFLFQLYNELDNSLVPREDPSAGFIKGGEVRFIEISRLPAASGQEVT
mgnify:CR=1 FL=1|jgi:hypothetical protein